MRFTGGRDTGRLLGLQLVGRLGSEIAKRIDTAATAIFTDMTIDAISDLDLSYSPPLGSPWDALQHGAQAWQREQVPSLGFAPCAGPAPSGGAWPDHGPTALSFAIAPSCD